MVAAMVASFLIGDPAGAGRVDAQRRAARAVAARVASDAAVNRAAPELAVFARALADGRMATATRIGDRLAADPSAMATAAQEVGAAQVGGALRDTICQLLRSLQVAHAGFPSVSRVFVSLLAAFGCQAPSTTSTTRGTSSTVGPSTTTGGPTTLAPTTLFVTTTSPTTSTTMGGPTTSGPTTTLPFCPPMPTSTTSPPTTVPCITTTTAP